MNYQEAKKKLEASKTKDNFLMIRINYDMKFVLPYKDGIAFLSAFANAEQLKEPYDKNHRIVPFDPDSFTTQILSRQQYERYKIAALLGISHTAVEEMEREPTPQTS